MNMLMLTLRLCAWSRTVIELLLLLTLLLNKSNSRRLLALRIQCCCAHESSFRVTCSSQIPFLSCISDVHNVRILRILSKLMHCVRVCRHRPGIMRFLPEGLSRRNNPFRSTELWHTWIVDPQHPHQRWKNLMAFWRHVIWFGGSPVLN